MFDQGLGDLFVNPRCGEYRGAFPDGSVEFAAERFGTRLGLVLGHSQCGAFLATLEELERPDALQSENLHLVVVGVEYSLETSVVHFLERVPQLD